MYCVDLLQSDRSDIESSNSPGLMVVAEKSLHLRTPFEKTKVLFNLIRHGYLLSDETWDAVFDSLKTHPTLQVLHLLLSRFIQALIAPQVALADMMKVYMSIHTIIM
jgi:hypothetical protein